MDKNLDCLSSQPMKCACCVFQNGMGPDMGTIAKSTSVSFTCNFVVQWVPLYPVHDKKFRPFASPGSDIQSLPAFTGSRSNLKCRTGDSKERLTPCGTTILLYDLPEESYSSLSATNTSSTIQVAGTTCSYCRELSCSESHSKLDYPGTRSALHVPK